VSALFDGWSVTAARAGGLAYLPRKNVGPVSDTGFIEDWLHASIGPER